MVERYTRIIRALRELGRKAQEGIDAIHFDGEGYTASLIGQFVHRELEELARAWPQHVDRSELDLALGDERPSTHEGFLRIRDELIPLLENRVDDYFSTQPAGDLGSAILELLHPAIVQASYTQFRQGHLRDAVFNSVIAVFDLIRARTGLDADGAALVDETFSLSQPRLVLSDLVTESGKNDQKGFLQIYKGAFQGVRNPKAHSLDHDLDQLKAAQYLVFASLLARRVDEASIPDGASTGKDDPARSITDR